MINIKMLLIGFLATILYFKSFGQNKPSINLETYKTWSTVSGGGISSNGKYAYYLVTNKPIGNNTFIVKAIDGNWEKEFLNATNPAFTGDSKYLIAQLPNDTLLKLDLSTKKYEKLDNIKSYELIIKGKSEEIMYLKKFPGDLMLTTVGGKESMLASNIEKYTIGPQRTSIIVEQRNHLGGRETQLTWIEFKTEKKEIIYRGLVPSKIVYDDSGNQVAFMVKNGDHCSLWNYRKDLHTSQIVAEEGNEGISDKFYLYENSYNFSKDGESIFFYLQDRTIKNSNSEMPELIISNYKDSYLQGDSKRYENNLCLSILNVKTKKVIQLQSGKEEVVAYTLKHKTDSIFVLKSTDGHYDESFQKNIKTTYYLCYSRTGKRKIIEQGKMEPLQQFTVSNTGKYIAYFDSEKKNYINFLTVTGEKIVVTENVKESITMFQLADYAKPEIFPAGIIGWMEDDKAFLVQGRYDIWCIDPVSQKAPINVTLGIGSRDKTIFTTIKQLANDQLVWNSDIVVSTFNTITKDFGFSKVRISDKPQIIKLSLIPTYISPLESGYLLAIDRSQLSKAEHTSAYLVLLQNATHAPNYYFSRNLKEFKQISNNQPQQSYNWLTAELHTYSDSSGRNYQGILYKPENFDSTRKYPIIFHYYEKFSNTLNEFPTVELPPANFSIPIAVSNGYLVFLPDIVSEIDRPGQGALRSVLAATNYLAKKDWVDTSKMAITGHSFGGLETNYIVTHTSIFKAAISGSAPSEIISLASDLFGESSDFSMQEYFLFSAPKMRKSLSESPEDYINNSPLLLGKNITTPLLLMHNQKDDNVPFRQSRQLFIMLRSLNKPVWWLNYRNETHGIGKEKNVLDYNTKALQFLDYFLKGKPEPKWMVDHL